jgi:2-amino-4-hydroxy-6-hydroxymethyldihydropteridine diphosphokinase
VLLPWRDVDPDAELLDHGPVAELLTKTGDQSLRQRDDLSLSF